MTRRGAREEDADERGAVPHAQDAGLIAGERHRGQVRHDRGDGAHLRPAIDRRILTRLRRPGAGREVCRVFEQAGNAELEVTYAGQVLVKPNLVGSADAALEPADVVADGVEHAATKRKRRVDNGLFAGGPERASEEPLKEHAGVGLGRVHLVGGNIGESAGTLLNGDFQRPVGGVGANLRGDDLVNRGAREGRVVAVHDERAACEEATRAGEMGHGVAGLDRHAADHRDMLADRGERRELLREFEACAGGGGDPLLGQDTVAPKEDDESAREGIGCCGARDRRTGHQLEPGQTYADGGAAQNTAKKATTGWLREVHGGSYWAFEAERKPSLITMPIIAGLRR